LSGKSKIFLLLSLLSAPIFADGEACWVNELTPDFDALPPTLGYARVDPGVTDEFVYVTSDARPYVDSFEMFGRLNINRRFKITRVSVRFVDKYPPGVKQDTIGECSTNFGMIPSITLLRSWWDSVDTYDREQLVFHELGHCVLYEGHYKRKFSNGMPQSMMYPEIIGARYYNKNRAYYIWRLFSDQRIDSGYIGKDVGSKYWKPSPRSIR